MLILRCFNPVLLILLVSTLSGLGQQSGVILVFDHSIRVDEVRSIMVQLPILEKLKNKVSVDLARIPFEDNSIVRYSAQQDLPAGFSKPLDCGVDPCKAMKQFMGYRNPSTNLLVWTSGSGLCNPGGVVTLCGSFELINSKLQELIGTKSGRKKNKEVIVMLSKDDGKIKPVVKIVQNDTTVFDGDPVRLTAKSEPKGCKFLWSSGNESSGTLEVVPLKTGYYSVVGIIGSCVSDPDSILVTVQSCTKSERLRVLWDIDNSIFTKHPVNGKSHFLYRTLLAGNNYVLVCNSSCSFPSYAMTVSSVDRKTVVFEKTYMLKEIMANSSLNSPEGPYPNTFVFSLGGVDRKYDFNYDGLFDIVVEGIDRNGQRHLNFKEQVQFSYCP